MKPLIAFALMATPALAEIRPASAPMRDQLEARASSENHWCEVSYTNVWPPASANGDHVLDCNGIEVIVQIRLGNPGERATIVVPSGELVPVPPEMVVDDGATGISQLMLPMF